METHNEKMTASASLPVSSSSHAIGSRTSTSNHGTNHAPILPAAASSSPSFSDFPVVGSADVAVFWDFQNVRIPAWCPATTASECIRNKVTKYGRIVEKRLYFDSRQYAELSAPRSDLDLSGFTLVDCPSRGRKETLDKKLIVDVLCFAWERASLGAKACVVLITSDGDYSYVLARLRDIGVFTVIIYRPDIVAKVLIDNANVVMSWEYDILGGPPESQDDDEDDVMSHLSTSSKQVVSESIEDDSSLIAFKNPENGSAAKQVSNDKASTKQPNLQTKGKFALFCSVVLNAQHRNVREGISVDSSWADEASCAATFYKKVGEKDRDGYVDIRTHASHKGFVEWGRRNLLAVGKPVIKVKDRLVRAEGLSQESYLRLTYLGLSVVKPATASKENDWTMDDLPKGDLTKSEALNSTTTTPTTTSPANAKIRNGKLFVGGLAWETTEDSLRSYFRQYGPIEFVYVKAGRGFGLVFFRHSSNAETVLKNAGHHVVDHKSVDVKAYNRNL